MFHHVESERQRREWSDPVRYCEMTSTMAEGVLKQLDSSHPLMLLSFEWRLDYERRPESSRNYTPRRCSYRRRRNLNGSITHVEWEIIAENDMKYTFPGFEILEYEVEDGHYVSE